MMSNEMDHIDPNIHSSIDTSVSWFLSFYFVNSYEKKRKYLFLLRLYRYSYVPMPMSSSRDLQSIFYVVFWSTWLSLNFWPDSVLSCHDNREDIFQRVQGYRPERNELSSQSLNSRDPGWFHIGFRQSLWTSNPVQSPKFSHVERFYPSRILATYSWLSPPNEPTQTG